VVDLEFGFEDGEDDVVAQGVGSSEPLIDLFPLVGGLLPTQGLQRSSSDAARHRIVLFVAGGVGV
jgi:hypothetical protein